MNLVWGGMYIQKNWSNLYPGLYHWSLSVFCLYVSSCVGIINYFKSFHHNSNYLREWLDIIILYMNAYGCKSLRTKDVFPVSRKNQEQIHYGSKRKKIERGQSRQVKNNYITISQIAYYRLLNWYMNLWKRTLEIP